ncbi:MAG: hypothetical protein L3J66_03620 [Bacteroidales bacterium]|nr:hypothetical protein [Bacteroidales bacterium]
MNTETQEIINHSFEYAKELLEDTGEFYPFGAYLDRRGQIHPLEFETDKRNMPTNGQVIEGLTKYCREEMKNGKMRGFGITYSAGVQLHEGEDAIETVAIDITLASGEIAPVYYLPYNITGTGTTEFGEIFAVKREDLNADKS